VTKSGQGASPMESVDEFLVVERTFSDDPAGLSIGLANIHAIVPDIEANKDKILRAAQVFRERGVDVAIFPEFSLSGYFWDDPAACGPYMEAALTENHLDWIDGSLRPLLGEGLGTVILNNLTRAPDGRHLNTTFGVTAAGHEMLGPDRTYNKVFLPGIEKDYTASGRDDRLVIESQRAHGRFGFTTCYDYLFSDLLREYAIGDGVDAIVQIASWRAAATRDYPRMNVRTDLYYGELWDMAMAASSAANQVWTIACNAVGRHGVSGALFWGGSGVWAPSGLRLVQASHVNEELIVVHNLDITGARDAERDEFDYSFDFHSVYRPLDGARTFTRMPL
jgi:predicted amidohydrolase